MGYPLWSKSEDKILRAGYARLSGTFFVSHIAEKVGRTYAAVQNRATLLGLTSKEHQGVAICGPRNKGWKGDGATDGSKRERAHRLFRLGPCERCGKEGVERHHKDANPGNNSKRNVMIVCRKCHMIIDGRLERYVAALRKKATTFQPAKPCLSCQRPYKPLRNGRCAACDSYFKRCGKDRPIGSYKPTQRAVGFQPGWSNPRANR